MTGPIAASGAPTGRTQASRSSCRTTRTCSTCWRPGFHAKACACRSSPRMQQSYIDSPRGENMQLYHHPASTTSRMVMLFAAENHIPLDMKVVDIFTGEHQGEAFS